MKRLVKIGAIVAGVAIAAVAAKANTESDVLSSGNGPDLNVVSTVTYNSITHLFDYTYAVSDAPGTGADGIDAFTVYSASSLSGSGVIVIPGPGTFTGTVNGSHVSWNDTPTVDATLPLTFEFTSTKPPTQGTAGALDTQVYGGNGINNSAHVFVPNPTAVPDGGTTMALLGGGLLALSGIRRRLV